jgi:hypothetical protein
MSCRRFFLVLPLLAAAGTSIAQADPCSPPGVNVPVVSGIGEIDIDSSIIDAGTLGKAIGDWRTCPQFGSGFPSLVPNGTGGVPATAILHPGRSTERNGRCGTTSVTYSGGRPTRIQIDLWSQQGNGSPCLPTYDNLAHELGHLLGEGDAGGGCNGHIMGAPTTAGAPRTVYPSDCSEADQMWKTPAEMSPPPPPPAQCPPDCTCPDTCESGCDSNGRCLDGGGDDPCLEDPVLCIPADFGPPRHAR